MVSDGKGQEPSILVVEDDTSLSQLMADFLSHHGYAVRMENSGNRAVSRITQDGPDLCILDATLPDLAGVEVCKQVRNLYKGLILMLTANEDTAEHVLSLQVGADDYVLKPVNPEVLLARIGALMRRRRDMAAKQERLNFGQLTVDAHRRECFLQGAKVDLSSAEFDLLWLLVSRSGTTCSRQSILETLRGIDYDGFDRSIDIRVSRLRKKIGDDPDNPKLIKTVRGVGYLFAPPGSTA